jgi:hypothetical protein
MLLNLFANLLCPFSSIARISKMEKHLEERIARLPDADQVFLHREPSSVSRFLLLLGSMGIADRGWVDSRIVRKINFYKSQSRGMEQEGIMLECKFGSCEETFHLLVECIHKGNTNPSVVFASAATPLSAYSDSSLQGWHLLKNRIGRVVGPEALIPPTRLIAVYEPPHDITLLEVCCLLDLLRKKSESSVIDRHKCIWLGDALWAVLQERYGNTSGGSDLGLVEPTGSGTCSHMEIVALSAEEIEQVSAELDAELERLIQEVSWT